MEVEKTRDERIAELLDKSGTDAVGAIKGPSLSTLTSPETKPDEVIEDAEQVDTETGGKKVRIPASRLKTLTTELKELREQASTLPSAMERIAALESQIANKDEEGLPDWWKEAYGDNDVSKQGYKNQQRIMREELQRGLQQVEREREAAETERAERIEAIESSFDEQMDGLEESLGRNLTDNQKAEIMDIVGEYSPQENGKYIGYMDISKAYELWQRGSASSAKREMADIAGIQSSGSAAPEPSKERPQWGDWRKRFGN